MPVYRDGQYYYGNGWKFLNPYGSTTYGDNEFIYPLPEPGQKWGPWVSHPDPAEPDGLDCGPGRLHVMNIPSAEYAPDNWWIWYVQYRGVIGQSDEKTAVRELRLRRVSSRAFWRMIRLGWFWNMNLHGAYLREADLHGANLSMTYLSESDLTGADLSRADLRFAILDGARLRTVNFSNADLSRASMMNSDMRGAILHKTNLVGANLCGADLRWADLQTVNLCEANLQDADLRWSTINNVYLRNADLSGARLPDYWKGT